MQSAQILLLNNLLDVPNSSADQAASGQELGTVLSNMAYYGYAPSLEALKKLKKLSSDELSNFWQKTKRVMADVTGANRNMSKFVVYKNFPKEVLEMSQAQYWFNQILMYLGAPNEWFQQAETAREPLNDNLKLKVLGLAQEPALWEILMALVASRARWTSSQKEQVLSLVDGQLVKELDLGDFGFKENGLTLIAARMKSLPITISDATDYLRLAAALSDADVSLRTSVKFKKFSRAERKFFCQGLEATKNLEADVATRGALWKKLLRQLHPGDYAVPRVCAAYDLLYRGKLVSFNAAAEANLFLQDEILLEQLKTRPGEFARRLHKVYAVFGMDAVKAFLEVVDELNTSQLLKLRGYLRTINNRKTLVYAPKGNWTAAKVVTNSKEQFSKKALSSLLSGIESVLAARLARQFPEGVDLDGNTREVKLQTNDQELAPYGRGTAFDIPKNIRFIRSASYWAHVGGGNTWFDNGWNFFREDWAPAGSCCWTETRHEGAVFSGDPTNSKDLKGRACQMIDLHLDQLEKAGVRYAVWNVLAFSHVPFEDAEEVLATLQWGEFATAGALYEPARAQMVFPLKGKNFTKYVALVDVKLRKLIYLDANLKGDVSSAEKNESTLSQQMPAFLEYLASLPSVADLFETAPRGETPVLYSDANVSLKTGQKAYVFRPENAANRFTPLRLEEFL